MADPNLIRKTSVSKFYRAWVNMKTRCDNPKSTWFHRYGGRGITYDKKWETFDGFIEDMLPSYKDELTLDRIDDNGNYSKENCRWATRKQQAQNTANVERARRLTYDGVTMTVRGWAEKLGIKRTTLDQRIRVYNWSIQDALERRVRP